MNGIAPGMFATGMTAGADAMDTAGTSHFAPDRKAHDFEVPVQMRPGEGHAGGPPYGTGRDMGALVLFLVANWFVDGETVLIDGGVSRRALLFSFLVYGRRNTHSQPKRPC